MWRLKINPDNNAIPLLTSLGDLLGTSLLTIMFLLLTSIAADSLAIFAILDEESDFEQTGFGNKTFR
jgi:hypothetical protein